MKRVNPLPLGPPVSLEEFKALLTTIKKSGTSHIDSEVMSAVVKLSYAFALKKADITGLKIDHVIGNNGQVRATVQIPRKSGISNIPVSDYERRTIQRYFEYLKRQDKYQTAPSAPFFPMKDGRPYVGKQIDRHLDRFADQDAVKKKCKVLRLQNKITLEDIKDAGLFRHYQRLTKTARDPDDPYLIDRMIRQTADFAGIKPRQAGSILQQTKWDESSTRLDNLARHTRDPRVSNEEQESERLNEAAEDIETSGYWEGDGEEEDEP